MWIQSLNWEDALEKEMATHCSILAWKIPWTEDPSRLQSMGSQRVGQDWATSLHYWVEGRSLKGRRLHKVTPGKKVKVKVAQSYLTLWSHGLYNPWNSPGQNTGVSGLSLHPGDLLNSGIKPRSPAFAGRFFTSWATREAQDTWRQGLLRLSGSLPATGSCKFREGTLLIQGHIGGKS